MLGLARFEGKPQHCIDARQLEQDEEKFVLVNETNNSYVSNKVCLVTSQVMMVKSGYYSNVSWQLKVTNPE